MYIKQTKEKKVILKKVCKVYSYKQKHFSVKQCKKKHIKLRKSEELKTKNSVKSI